MRMLPQFSQRRLDLVSSTSKTTTAKSNLDGSGVVHLVELLSPQAL
jgi:hypothetical protein